MAINTIAIYAFAKDRKAKINRRKLTGSQKKSEPSELGEPYERIELKELHETEAQDFSLQEETEVTEQAEVAERSGGNRGRWERQNDEQEFSTRRK